MPEPLTRRELLALWHLVDEKLRKGYSAISNVNTHESTKLDALGEHLSTLVDEADA
jgi:hypothetical protein